jgi:glycosyltransferase involved in cell wall biosynthesis
VSWWIPRFDPEAFQFHVCSLRAPEQGVEVFKAAGVEVTFLSKGKLDPSTVTALLRVISRERPDVLHLHGYGATNFGRLAGFIKGIPRIVHEHSPIPDQPTYQTVADMLLSPFTTRAIAVSDKVGEFMVRERKIPAALIDTFFVGVPLNEFQSPDPDTLLALKEEFAIGPDEKIVSTVGRLDKVKGQTDLLRAAAEAIKVFAKTRVLIIGDGPDLQMLQSLVRELGIEKNVSFTGYRTDIPAFLSISDVVAVPSLWEGGPLTVLEAMEMGIPVIGTTVGLMPELIHDGENGFLVEPRDWRGLSDKLLTLLRDPHLAVAMGERGKAISKQYDISNAVERLARIYQDLAPESIRGSGPVGA